MTPAAILRVLAVALCLAAAPAAADGPIDPGEVQALFVRNFAEFLRWPSEEGASLRLCVFSRSADAQPLGSLKDRPLRKMRIAVTTIAHARDAAACQMVYLPAADSDHLGDLLQATARAPVVIVAEQEGLANLGAAFSFAARSGGYLSFDINLGALRGRGIEASARLINLARRVF